MYAMALKKKNPHYFQVVFPPRKKLTWGALTEMLRASLETNCCRANRFQKFSTALVSGAKICGYLVLRQGVGFVGCASTVFSTCGLGVGFHEQSQASFWFKPFRMANTFGGGGHELLES